MMVDTAAPSAVAERIRQLCRQFKLPTLAAETVGRFSEAGHADALETLLEVMEQEAEDRRIRRVDRLRRTSKLPAGKTWETFEHGRTPVQLRQQLQRLVEGDFVDHGVNVLAFGMPGTGKTHAMCAIGHRLVESSHSVLFIPAYRLVQDMLAAKRDLELPRILRKLDNFDLLVIDDLGYLPQGAEESEVLFTLIAERYERRSLGVTSNLVFSEWEKVFANPMATAAAIDRIVHHSVILGVRPAKLQDQCGQESSVRGGTRPARIIDAPVKMVDVDQAPTSKPRTAILTPFAAPSYTTQAKTALFRGFLGVAKVDANWNMGCLEVAQPMWFKRNCVVFAACDTLGSETLGHNTRLSGGRGLWSPRINGSTRSHLC